MRNRFVLVACFLAVIMALPMNVSAKEIVLKIAEWGPEQHYVPQARSKWIEDLNEKFEGKVKIERYPGGQLYGPKDMHTAVAKGSVDMGVTLVPSMMATIPLLQGVYLPFAFDSIDQVAKAYEGESREIIEDALAKKRLKLIWVSYLDGVQLFSNKGLVKTVDDFKGLRILAASPMFSEIMVKLGAAPDTSIPQDEQYMALKRGVSNATANSTVGGYFQKTHEVAPYYTQMDMSWAMTFVVMNARSWERLPQDYKDYMLKSGEKAAQETLQATKGWEKKFRGVMNSEGAYIGEFPTEERDKIKEISLPVWEAWAEKNGKQAKRLLELNLKLAE